MNKYEVSGFYGNNNPATILVCTTREGSWYCVEGSQNVNFTVDTLNEGVDIEMLQDDDVFTSKNPIMNLDELEIAVNS